MCATLMPPSTANCVRSGDASGAADKGMFSARVCMVSSIENATDEAPATAHHHRKTNTASASAAPAKQR
jgi:hypothetical protein